MAQPYGMIIDSPRKYAVYPTHANAADEPRTEPTVSFLTILEAKGQLSL